MRRPQLTLRDLFWLVLVVSLCVGWGLTGISLSITSQRLAAITEEQKYLQQAQRNDAQNYNALKRAIESEGYEVFDSDKLRLYKLIDE